MCLLAGAAGGEEGWNGGWRTLHYNSRAAQILKAVKSGRWPQQWQEALLKPKQGRGPKDDEAHEEDAVRSRKRDMDIHNRTGSVEVPTELLVGLLLTLGLDSEDRENHLKREHDFGPESQAIWEFTRRDFRSRLQRP
ncbi:hypothetical protein B296_00016553 [Ensete ventricosum]|uniref:Uncharacterized protein n=1 Tax=Ensete ventricosum TaxID=4639 RepID=A0A427AA54_ENSVE|nr:hypothetical protein B296_00016553 [Ensete ventricosum]